MKENKEVRISYWAAHLTTIVSVTLVLLIVGIIAMVTISAASETRRLRERIELNAVMADSVSDAAAAAACRAIAAMPEVRQARLITSRQALDNWRADTGEDLERLFGVNPLSPEVSFTVRADRASAESLSALSARVAALPGVAEVAAPDATLVDNMNRNIEGLSYILGGVGVVMLIISFVLINNTVHLATYSRRFTIHTMQLVGATNGFIRRPFVLNNLLSGVIAALVASGIIALALAGARHAGLDNMADYVSWPAFGVIAAGLLLTGMLICSLAASIATGRYLRKDYDELFR